MKVALRTFAALLFAPAIVMMVEGLVFAFNGSHILPAATEAMAAVRALMTWLFTSAGIVTLGITWGMK